MDQYQAFEAFLIVFFYMCAVAMLIAVAGIIDAYLDPEPDGAAWDRQTQNNLTKGVKL